MAEHPAPLTTPDMDVRELDGFMLNVERIMASELVALSKGDEFKAAFLLWCRAWKQVPAGSLPNDDAVLAAFSGAGSKWPKVRGMALRGFVECSDGRLYHKTLCEDVYRAWSAKQEFKDRQSGDADRKRREREERSQMFSELKTVGITPEWNIPTRALRELVTAHVTKSGHGGTVTSHAPVTPPVTRTVTAITGRDRTGQDKDRSSLRSESSELGLEVERGQSAPNSENPTQRSKNADEIGSDFKIWYAKFPRHEALARAEKAYRAARKSGATAAELLAGAERYARLRAGEDKRYTQLPASWLNGRCWLDELPPQAVGEPEPKSPEMLSATRRVYLRDWAAGKPWIANISGNGVWIDEYGIGPPPGDPRTLVTPEDLAAVPAARERLEAIKQGAVTA